MHGLFCGYCMDEPCTCSDDDSVKKMHLSETETEAEAERDKFIAMKMLVRFNELRKEQPKKPRPDIGWMLDILSTARYFGAQYDAQHTV